MIRHALKKVVESENLTVQEAREAMDCIMEGRATDAQISSFITALRMKGETVDEIIGFVRVMRSKATPIAVRDSRAIDTCGTGGDGKNTLNVSTIAAFVAAGAGVTVAKHGNRSVSSRCGSADLLASLGIDITIKPEKIEECLAKAGIGFLFAPMLHKAMRFAVNPRKEIGFRTVFNILGPLTNPAGVKHQLIGVFDKKLTEPLAHVLQGLGATRALIVHGDDGLDEISISSTTTVSELLNGNVRTFTIAPEDFGFSRSDISEIAGGDTEKNKKISLSILKGEQCPGRDIALLNAGAAVAVSHPSFSLKDGIKKARESLDSGKALQKLNHLIEVSNS